jgi:bacterioferritin-associated ferredoxin
VWVCYCLAINSGTIQERLDEGACTVKEIVATTGAGTDCGKCARTIYVLIEQHRRSNA